ncbi:hypothetical protein DL770_002438 [Monosporascus sp. CRB-9-2]|nr:hypothetical protein DL770_002438 [Monosporascus sp. CRB-9-2]
MDSGNQNNTQELLRQRQHDAQRRAVLTAKQAIGQQLTVVDAEELDGIKAREDAGLEARRKQLEAPFAHLPPLPPPLPPFSGGGAPPQAEEKDFHNWCRDGNIEAVRRYIEGRQQLDDAVLQRGLTHAAEGGQLETTRYLLQKGAKLFGVPIETACRRRDLELFKVFVENGWHPNQQIPSIEGNFGVVLPHCTGDLKITQFLLSHGGDPNLGTFDRRKRSGLGSTPPLDRQSGAALTSAAAHGNIEVIDLLLENGATLEWATPLHAALSVPGAWRRNRSAFEHLLRLGADPNKNIQFDFGNLWEMGTPLLWAYRQCNWEAIELLLEWGADPDVGNIVRSDAESRGFGAGQQAQQRAQHAYSRAGGPAVGEDHGLINSENTSEKAGKLAEIVERTRRKKSSSLEHDPPSQGIPHDK